MRLLIVNAGSSSLKLRLLGADDETLAEHELALERAEIDEGRLAAVLASDFGRPDAVAHRVVHGGERFHTAVRVDGEVVSELRALVDLAPLHQPKSLAALAAVDRVLPATPSFACFDTSFHSTLAPAASTYALPLAWRERWPLRRFGFHGLSHSWVARRVPELLDRDAAELRIVSCHLGAGASICAIRGGQSVDTTMGFTPLDGLVMATRCGSLDPGLVLWLLEHEGVAVAELGDALEHESGLRGLGGSGDMRELLERARTRDARALLALEVYEHRLVGAIGAMTASLGGLDVLVFTGGVGERATTIRHRTAERLRFLGVRLDGARNDETQGDADVSAADCAVRTVVVTAREDLEMARQVRLAMAGR